MVSVKKEERKSKVNTLMIKIDAENEGSKEHTSLVAESKYASKENGGLVKNSMPPLVYDIFTKQWGDFIETCSQRGEHIEDSG